jgi:hypothetical protein
MLINSAEQQRFSVTEVMNIVKYPATNPGEDSKTKDHKEGQFECTSSTCFPW